jgi:hypothetical protein
VRPLGSGDAATLAAYVPVGLGVAAQGGAEVGVPDRPGEPGVAEPLRVGAGVEHDLHPGGVTVLGVVEPEAGDAAALHLGAGVDVDDLDLLVRGSRGGVRDGQPRAAHPDRGRRGAGEHRPGSPQGGSFHGGSPL